jgi:thiamine-phosphate pyrophosphorylase
MIRYFVTDRRQGDLITAVRRAVKDGVDMIQIREKDLTAGELLSLTLRIRDLAAGSGTRVLVNDRLDVALAAGIDGVHLPSNGLPARLVKPFAGILGVSTHTLEEAVSAEKDGAGFVVFGPIFDSPGKTPVGLEPLRQVVRAVRIPVLAIGGVTAANTREIMDAGAKGIAGIRMFFEESL